MTKFLFLRHGESKTNNSGKFCGQIDSDLTDVGLEQAQDVAKYIVKHHNDIDAIFSSDLIRVVKTVEPTAKMLGKEIVLNKDLREINVGNWAGKTPDEIRELTPNLYERYRRGDTSVKLGDAESFDDVHARALAVVNQIARDYDGKKVLVGAHGGVIRMLCKNWLNVSDVVMRTKYCIANASLTEVDYDGKDARVVSVNNMSYLGTKTGDKETSVNFQEKD